MLSLLTESLAAVAVGNVAMTRIQLLNAVNERIKPASYILLQHLRCLHLRP